MLIFYRFLEPVDGSPRVRTAPSYFSPDEAKTAGNTLCINEDFGKIWRKICKQDVRGEIRRQALRPVQINQKMSSITFLRVSADFLRAIAS